jgi:hypothetical protein
VRTPEEVVHATPDPFTRVAPKGDQANADADGRQPTATEVAVSKTDGRISLRAHLENASPDSTARELSEELERYERALEARFPDSTFAGNGNHYREQALKWQRSHLGSRLRTNALSRYAVLFGLVAWGLAGLATAYSKLG